MDCFRCTDDGRNQVAAGDLEVDPGIAQEPIDPFNGMFGGRGLGHRQTMPHRGDAQQRLPDWGPHQRG